MLLCFVQFFPFFIMSFFNFIALYLMLLRFQSIVFFWGLLPRCCRDHVSIQSIQGNLVLEHDPLRQRWTFQLIHGFCSNGMPVNILMGCALDDMNRQGISLWALNIHNPVSLCDWSQFHSASLVAISTQWTRLWMHVPKIGGLSSYLWGIYVGIACTTLVQLQCSCSCSLQCSTSHHAMPTFIQNGYI